MKQVKIFGITVAVLFLCMVGRVCDSHAASIKGSVEGEVKIFEENRKQLPALHSIEADLTDLDLKIVSTKKQKSSLSYSIYCKNSKNPLTYSVKNGVLYLKETGIKELSSKELKQKTGKKWWRYWPKVTLYVPADTVIKSSRAIMDEGNLQVNSTDGDIVLHLDKKEVHSLSMTVGTKCGDMLVLGKLGNGKKKAKGDGWYYEKKGSGKGRLKVVTEDGDILLK